MLVKDKEVLLAVTSRGNLVSYHFPPSPLPQVTIGVFGYPEHIIMEPLSPKEISSIVYGQCMPYEPVEAVLQQEVGFFQEVFHLIC